jgi:hypothetical protein
MFDVVGGNRGIYRLFCVADLWTLPLRFMADIEQINRQFVCLL